LHIILCDIDFYYWIGGSNTSRTGSFNAFTNHKLYYLDTFSNKGIRANIEIAYASCGKGFYRIKHHYSTGGSMTTGLITGSISVFSECYDLEYYSITEYDVIGTVSMLNKLQKLRWVSVTHLTRVTGSKEDLWNNGANIEHFGSWEY